MAGPRELAPNKRTVITGIGLVTPFGVDLASNFEALRAGRSAISTLEPKEAYERCLTHIGGQLPFDVRDLFNAKARLQTYTAVQMAELALQAAVKDAGFDFDQSGDFAPGRRKSLIIGTSAGDMPYIIGENKIFEQQGPSRELMHAPLRLLSERTASYPGMRHNIHGPTFGVSAACATGSIAFTEIVEKLQYNHSGRGRISRNDPDATDSDLGLAGATEAGSKHPFVIGMFNSLGALSTRNDDPETASRPLDKDRDGFVFTDAAAMLVLEPYDLAKARGARMYAEVYGYANRADAYKPVDPSEDEVLATMDLACKRAGILPRQLGLIKGHLTSTPNGDRTETKAIKRLLGKKDEVPVISLKDKLGHSVGAAGAVELAILAWMIDQQKIFAMRNVFNFDSSLPDLNYILAKNENGHQSFYQSAEIEFALANCFGFGGLNSSVVLGRVA